MRSFLMLPAVSAIFLLISGCSTPQENANLLQAREDFSALQSKPESQTLAAIETREAFASLGKADLLSIRDRKSPEVEQQAYLALQKIALAEQTIKWRKAEKSLKNIGAERTQVQLDVRTAQLKALQELKAKKTERGSVVTFGDVLFDTGKAEIKPGSLRSLEQLADFLRDNPERKVRVEGFTDSTGSESFNLELSARRAQAVGFALQRYGVDPGRIVTNGYGSDYPIASNATAGTRQFNRRVEVIISFDAVSVKARS